MTRSLWADDPTRNQAEDKLNRAAFAKSIAKLVASVGSWESSVVFGLTGPWGSGKTSLINTIVEALATSHAEWGVAPFTPWASGDVDGLLAAQTARPNRRSRRLPQHDPVQTPGHVSTRSLSSRPAE